LLGWVAALHLLARGWLERRLPDPSFAQDVRTGNFEQLRLAPFTAHGLLIQRGLPDMLFRATTQIVWLPVYAIVVGALGASLADACALWLLFSFANYAVLGLVSLTLLIPVEEVVWTLLCGTAGVCVSVGWRARAHGSVQQQPVQRDACAADCRTGVAADSGDGDAAEPAPVSLCGCWWSGCALSGWRAG
jgi:hypothetical protein